MKILADAESLPRLDQQEHTGMIPMVEIGSGLPAQQQLKFFIGQQLTLVIKCKSRIEAPFTEIANANSFPTKCVLLRKGHKPERKHDENDCSSPVHDQKRGQVTGI